MWGAAVVKDNPRLRYPPWKYERLCSVRPCKSGSSNEFRDCVQPRRELECEALRSRPSETPCDNEALISPDRPGSKKWTFQRPEYIHHPDPSYPGAPHRLHRLHSYPAHREARFKVHW